jgi:CHAD domain-containing protein
MHDQTDRRRITPALLDMPAPHSARVIASGLLDEWLEAHARFEDDDPDGLHDLRVAMRRLRSWLRAFRPELSDTVRGRTRRRLRDLASATNEARDAEVALAFIERQTKLSARARATARVVVGQLEHERDGHASDMRQTLEQDLRKATRALADQLESYWERHRIHERSAVRPMSVVFAEVLQQHAKRLESALGRIVPPGRGDDVHRARIAAKRLRYLLEPLDEPLGAAEPIEQLRTLQRQLGDARDAQRITTRLIREIGERAARDGRTRALTSLGITQSDDGEPNGIAATRAGLTELARRARSAHETAFAEFSRQWGDGEVSALCERIRDVAARIAGGRNAG